MTHTCNSSVWEAETRGPRIPGQHSFKGRQFFKTEKKARVNWGRRLCGEWTCHTVWGYKAEPSKPQADVAAFTRQTEVTGDQLAS